MSDTPELVFETDLEAPPDKVWRALTVPEYLERWLQKPDEAKLTLVASKDRAELTYRLSEPDNESLVTFEIEGNGSGGTFFRLTHAPAAANSNEPLPETLMLAA